MKRNWKQLAASAVLAASMLALSACGGSAEATAAESTGASAESSGTEAAESSTAAAQENASEGSSAAVQAENTGESGAAKEQVADNGEGGADESHYIDDTKLRVGSLKGPTTMGLVNMISENEAGELPFQAEFTMAAAADELSAKLSSGDLDIALIPANLASVLYNKTEGGLQVIDINTLGVLYGVTGDASVTQLSDLAGKTVYMTGQGTTPQFAFEYILKENGLSDQVKIEYKSEATEIAALLKEDPEKIAVLPQPFATVTQQQNPDVKEFMNLTEEWKKCESSGESELVTGVTVVRSDFLAEHEALVAEFVLEHEDSALKANEDVDGTAELVAKYGIIEKAPVAKLALPKCNIVCLTGADMEEALSGYLDVLYQANPQSVGGKLPGEAFYAFVGAAE